MKTGSARLARLAVVGALLIASIGCTAPGNAEAPGLAKYTMRLRAQVLPDYFKYKNTALKPAVRIAVDYCDNEKESKFEPYEFLWYFNGKPYGLERLGSLTPSAKNPGIEPITGVDLKVQYIGTPGESDRKSACKAAANAILRLLVDLQLHGNFVITVFVPDNSFSDICNSLEDQKFIAITDPGQEQAALSGLQLLVQTDSGNSNQAFYYGG